MNSTNTSLVLKRPDGQTRKVSGYRYAAAPAGSRSFDPGTANVSRLPPQVDLRPKLTAVEDQGETNSCAANAAAGAYEYLMKRHMGDEAYDVSRLFIYYNARELEGNGGVEDQGSILSLVIEGLKQYGAPSEQSWPFDRASVNEKPAEEVYAEASGFVIEGMELVPTNLEAWKTALAAGNPIIFGCLLFESFDKQKKAGLVPMPTPQEAGRESHGGHAMLCVGYSDKDEVFIVRNSWGTSWGDDGYCYIPYRYLMNPKYNGGDSWLIRNVEVLPVDESTWGDGTESMLEDVTTALGSMDDETYGALVDACGQHALETRLAILFLACAGADGTASSEEVTRISEHMAPVLEQLGGHTNAQAIIENSSALLGDEALVNETIDLFAQFFPAETLASIAGQLEDAAGADDLDESEAAMVDTIIQRWQLGDGTEGGEVADDTEGELVDETDGGELAYGDTEEYAPDAVDNGF